MTTKEIPANPSVQGIDDLVILMLFFSQVNGTFRFILIELGAFIVTESASLTL